MRERLAMSTRDRDRLKVIQTVLAERLTWKEAAEHLRLTARQIGNLCARVRKEGARGILHRLRGRPSNHRLPAEGVKHAVALVARKYRDFGPTFAAEKLRQRHGLELSASTLRRAMIEAGLWTAR